MRLNQSQRTTCLLLKPKSYYHLLTTSRGQIYTQESGCVECSTCKISFGVAGNESIACCCKNARNGTNPAPTVKLVMLSWCVTKLVPETDCHLQKIRKFCPAMMVWFVKSVCLLLNLVQERCFKGLYTSSSWFIDQANKEVQTTWVRPHRGAWTETFKCLERLNFVYVVHCNFIHSCNVWGSHVTPSQL